MSMLGYPPPPPPSRPPKVFAHGWVSRFQQAAPLVLDPLESGSLVRIRKPANHPPLLEQLHLPAHLFTHQLASLCTRLAARCRVHPRWSCASRPLWLPPVRTSMPLSVTGASGITTYDPSACPLSVPSPRPAASRWGQAQGFRSGVHCPAQNCQPLAVVPTATATVCPGFVREALAAGVGQALPCGGPGTWRLSLALCRCGLHRIQRKCVCAAGVTEDMLETIVPKRAGQDVMIVRGKYRGQVAVMHSRDAAKERFAPRRSAVPAPILCWLLPPTTVPPPPQRRARTHSPVRRRSTHTHTHTQVSFVNPFTWWDRWHRKLTTHQSELPSSARGQGPVSATGSRVSIFRAPPPGHTQCRPRSLPRMLQPSRRQYSRN